jgi:hypothetical protein
MDEMLQTDEKAIRGAETRKWEASIEIRTKNKKVPVNEHRDLLPIE